MAYGDAPLDFFDLDELAHVEKLKKRVDTFKVDVAKLTEFMQQRAKGAAPIFQPSQQDLDGLIVEPLDKKVLYSGNGYLS